MLKRHEKYLLALSLVIGILGIVALHSLTIQVAKDYFLYQKESECVHTFIMKNYRRIDIETGNGTCWIKGVEQ